MNRLSNEFAYRTRRTNGNFRRGMLAAALVAAAVAGVVPLATAHAPGSGAAGGCDGYAMGTNMMGGYGMGPGMMGGWGGYGVGPGMMGSYGMGPGTMGSADGRWGTMHGYERGAGTFSGLDLSDEQRSKISSIQRDLRSRQLKLMGELHDQYDRRADAKDDEVATKADEQIGALRLQMLGNANTAHKEINAVLSKEQRRQLWHGGD